MMGSILRVERRRRRNPYDETRAVISEAIERVDRNADPAWKAAADEALVWCARRFPEFTSDHIWDRLFDMGVRKPHTPSALGPVFLRGKRCGLIANTGQLQAVSKYSQGHRPLTIWRSQLR